MLIRASALIISLNMVTLDKMNKNVLKNVLDGHSFAGHLIAIIP